MRSGSFKKAVGTNHIGKFRPIAILPVLLKLYGIVILLLVGPDPMQRLVAPQFAYRRGHQAHEAVFILRQVVEKSKEFDMGICIADGDVKKAFDSTTFELVDQGLNKLGVRKPLADAWMTGGAPQSV